MTSRSPQWGHTNHDMFSMMPRTGRLTFFAIAADSRATFCAAGCGVVTTRTSAFGRYWLSDSAMSPVPGGMSMAEGAQSLWHSQEGQITFVKLLLRDRHGELPDEEIARMEAEAGIPPGGDSNADPNAPPDPGAPPAPPAAPAGDALESLEEEMARLLGRPEKE